MHSFFHCLVHRFADRRFATSRRLACGAVILSLGCSGQDGDTHPSADGPWTSGAKIAAEKQERGDAARGEQIMLNGSYMSCGVPLKLWDHPVVGPSVHQTVGSDGEIGVPGREGRNAELPHTLTAFTTTEGVEVINRNCLTCHAGKFDGELVIGLGNAVADFTAGLTNGNDGSPIPDVILDLVGLNALEKANLDKVLRVGRIFGPEMVMRTVGQNPADAMGGTLFAHHDPVTLAWSEAPLLPVVVHDGQGGVIETPRLTADPPPWWRSRKKNAFFSNGSARGDHRATMAFATAPCVDDVPEAERVDALLVDMQAYIDALPVPLYKRAIDRALADRGKSIFGATCAGCHGTYASDPRDDAHDTYPNLLIPLGVIGTDTVVANLGTVHTPEYFERYNASFYGKITRAVPSDPFPGYMAPPLDGVWATGPYLHNGSVPSIELVLNSKARPTVWKRVDLDDTHFDETSLGFPWEAVPYSQANAPADEQKFIYDTTYWSQSNSGHTFGDALREEERRAVIEYLKTL